MHCLDNSGSFTGVLEPKDLNPLICMRLLGQVSREAFSKIALVTYRKGIKPIFNGFPSQLS